MEAVPPERIPERDRELLKLAAGLLPRVAFDPLDLLIVDWMGKNLSGSGMDYNIIGLWRRIEGVERRPFFKHIAVLNLSPESGGNAIGVGAADFTTRKLFDADRSAQDLHERPDGQRPVHGQDPADHGERPRGHHAWRCGRRIRRGSRAWCASTARCTWPSTRSRPPCWTRPGSLPDLEIVGEAEPMRFDEAGNLA